jgi:hypothetical protein
MSTIYWYYTFYWIVRVCVDKCMCVQMSINQCIRAQRAQRKRDILADRRLTRSVDSLRATSGWVPVGRVTVGRTLFKKDLLVLAPIPGGRQIVLTFDDQEVLFNICL